MRSRRRSQASTTRACAPDQNRLVLKLKAGKNQLLMKVYQNFGDWAFYFQSLKNSQDLYMNKSARSFTILSSNPKIVSFQRRSAEFPHAPR